MTLPNLLFSNDSKLCGKWASVKSGACLKSLSDVDDVSYFENHRDDLLHVFCSGYCEIFENDCKGKRMNEQIDAVNPMASLNSSIRLLVFNVLRRYIRCST